MIPQNIVIGAPLVGMSELVAYDFSDWFKNERKVTYFTQTRNLPAVLKEAGIVSSASEVRRNKPELVKTFSDDFTDCFWVKWGKKKVFVVVGKANIP